MSVRVLKLDGENEEVYQVETEVEFSIPATVDNEIFNNAISFTIITSEGDYLFTLTKKGFEEMIKFYEQNKELLV